MVIVTTNRGPWKLCPNFSCPGKAEEAKKKEAKAAAKKSGKKLLPRKKQHQKRVPHKICLKDAYDKNPCDSVE